MRHNSKHLPERLLSGVRGDVAVKIFGEDFGFLLPFANKVATILSEVPDNDGVKVEKISGLPFINASVDLLRTGRIGLKPAEIHQQRLEGRDQASFNREIEGLISSLDIRNLLARI